jgi:hypothetical protein
MVVGPSSDEGIGEREGLKGRREARDKECRHVWFSRLENSGDKKERMEIR